MGKSLLTNEVKNQLLALYKQGLTNREIAKQLNVNNSTISS
jgi:DNA-binding NarL/FixJ family response regulator